MMIKSIIHAKNLSFHFARIINKFRWSMYLLQKGTVIAFLSSVSLNTTKKLGASVWRRQNIISLLSWPSSTFAAFFVFCCRCLGRLSTSTAGKIGILTSETACSEIGSQPSKLHRALSHRTLYDGRSWCNIQKVLHCTHLRLYSTVYFLGHVYILQSLLLLTSIIRICADLGCSFAPHPLLLALELSTSVRKARLGWQT